MSLRWPLLLVLLVLNVVAYAALWHTVSLCVRQQARRQAFRRWLAVCLVILNAPLSVFFSQRLDDMLLKVSTTALAVFFYPSAAWLATVIAFGMLAGPVFLIAAAFFRRGQRRGAQPAGASRARAGSGSGSALAVSRRQFVAGSAGLLIPGIYAVACYGSYGNLDQLEISPLRQVFIPNLPRSLEGMTIAQVSDLHVGAYIREKELRFVVDRINALRPDLIAVTGDILDLTLKSLPDAVRGLSALQAPLGTFAVLGNHDIYADQHSYSRQHRGGVRIAEGMQTIGIRTLRNEVANLGEGPDRLALLGMDWLDPNPYQPNFYHFKERETVQELRRMSEQVEAGTPKLLLVHHPDTFQEVGPFQIPLTLSGHTHGGGQIILGHLGGVPLGVGLVRFKYLSGLYQEDKGSLYVNRGIGYLGIPIRINCPPEISRFRLTGSATT